MSWNHRVLAHKDGDGVYFKIHEVYYDGDGKPSSYTANGVSVGADNIEGVSWVLDKMKESLSKPILSADNFPNKWVGSKKIRSKILQSIIDSTPQSVKDEVDLIAERMVKSNTQIGVITITKELFIEVMDKIQQQDKKDIDYCRALGKVLHPHIEPYDNSLIRDELVKLLQVAFKDDHAHSWIEYYCWELEFGKKYTDGCATRKDGTNIDLSDAGKLYDYLNEEHH